MIIVAYDFVSNKKRAKFSKFLKQYGEKIQYSVYKIKNSDRVLNNIISEIEHKYERTFDNTDSIFLFRVCQRCQKSLKLYGNAKHHRENVVNLG
ncbi:MAG: CRISPR-associated endonuclease Cas2 [Candidatus Shapirobacteria bacterium]|nr:CRISPR-associated endonuclease Cas2 [Candidatus Shapirobacteria bacterium]